MVLIPGNFLGYASLKNEMDHFPLLDASLNCNKVLGYPGFE
jgi:hypothetical protein